MRTGILGFMRASARVAFLLFSAYCLWTAARFVWRANASHVECSRSLDYADLVAGMHGWDIGYVATNARDLDPIDRDRVIHMSWEVSPGTVTPVSRDEIDAWNGVLVGPSGATPEAEERYEENGFYTMAYNESATLRSRVGLHVEPRDEHAAWCLSALGLLGAFASMAALGMLWRWLHVGNWPSFALVALGLAVFAVLASVSMRCGLTSPNGLATYAGKAKLFLLAHGIPAGFFTSPAYEVYQPAYPPGMVLPPLVAFAIGGFENAWMQLFVPFVLSLLFLELLPCPSPASIALAAAYVLCPVAQQFSIGFYAEPLCALLLVLGYRNMRAGKTALGWTVIGFAGLVRTEGFLLAGLLWLFSSISNRNLEWRSLAAVLVPGAAWQLLITIVGTRLQGWDFASIPSLDVMLHSSVQVGRQLVAGFESGMGALVLLISLGVIAGGRGKVAVPVFICAVALGLVSMGFATTRHVEWVLHTVFDRFLWLSLSILVYDVASATVER